jgi:hypothetical protein
VLFIVIWFIKRYDKFRKRYIHATFLIFSLLSTEEHLRQNVALRGFETKINAFSLATFYAGVTYRDNKERVFSFVNDTKIDRASKHDASIKTRNNLIYTRGLRHLSKIKWPLVSMLFLLLI